MDFEIDLLAKTIRTIDTNQCIIRVKRNFDYNTKGLESYSPYINLLNVTQKFHPEVKESHALVAFWMMQMNKEMARELHQNKTGIFRISTSSREILDSASTKDSTQDIFLYIWENAISGKYVTYSDNISDYTHVVIDVPIYTHFTSPIRRIVDIYNQMSWISIKEKRETKLVLDIDTINQDTKIIRKIQQESKIVYLLQDTDTNTSLQMEGQILQIEEKNTIVYLPEYNGIVSCKTNVHSKWQLHQKVQCRIYMFERETDYRKKIKMEIL
jgi:exoribonuclease R